MQFGTLKVTAFAVARTAVTFLLNFHKSYPQASDRNQNVETGLLNKSFFENFRGDHIIFNRCVD
jgi:hypothetical protein